MKEERKAMNVIAVEVLQSLETCADFECLVRSIETGRVRSLGDFAAAISMMRSCSLVDEALSRIDVATGGLTRAHAVWRMGTVFDGIPRNLKRSGT